MGDIELLIKINEEQYKFIKQSMTFDAVKNYPALLYDICEHIANGTPLPKGHGDLKDADKLKHTFIKWSMAVQGNFTDADIASIVYNSPTIIEAYKAER